MLALLRVTVLSVALCPSWVEAALTVGGSESEDNPELERVVVPACSSVPQAGELYWYGVRYDAEAAKYAYLEREEYNSGCALRELFLPRYIVVWCRRQQSHDCSNIKYWTNSETLYLVIWPE